ncbi:unnamed protein product [Dibothriocephalus latus]|uniref:Uncharacterized protein n=1 Tax=Dibothriocephalus latus TaxID=60516 RepID=A0A3P7LYH1_DIBLA|nr:unnamed protein product [Dibothriocephalus latus]
MLRRARALMEVLIELEDFVRIDVVTIFSNVFGNHTQPRDPTKVIALFFSSLHAGLESSM